MVAIKIAKRDIDFSFDLCVRLKREAHALRCLQHPSVVRIFSVIEVDGRPAFVMELLEGESLACRLERTGRLSVAEVGLLGVYLAEALLEAHDAGIIHRDLKPDNVFLVQGHSFVAPKILDFGIAKLVSKDRDSLSWDDVSTKAGTVIGSPLYMSPEQLRSESNIDGRTDVWSLGVMLYECLCGTGPATGKNIAQVIITILEGARPILDVAPHLPHDVAALVMRMLRRPREERPTLTEVISVLESHTLRPDAIVGPRTVAPLATTMVPLAPDVY